MPVKVKLLEVQQPPLDAVGSSTTGPPCLGFLVADNRRIAESSQSTKDQVMVSPGEDVGQHHKVGAPNVSATAQSCLECCSAAFSKETLAEASGLGSALLLETGSLESAVHALQEVRLLKHGDLLAAAVNGQIEGVSRLHAEYLKEMAELGVPSRRSDLPVRVEAHNHGSVHGYEEELLSKAWKDAAYGAVLLVDPSRSGVAEILESSRVAESPLGWVPKQNPDRTISSEGRPINDMRLQNSKGSKFNHPPAPQPRHQSVARQSLWWHARHPGVPQRCAKRDVPRAFKSVRCFRVRSETCGDHHCQSGDAFWMGRSTWRVCCLVYGSTGSPQGLPPRCQSGTTSSLMSPSGSWTTGWS